MRDTTRSMAEHAMVFVLVNTGKSLVRFGLRLRVLLPAVLLVLLASGCGAKAYEAVGVGETKETGKASEADAPGYDSDVSDAEEETDSAGTGESAAADKAAGTTGEDAESVSTAQTESGSSESRSEGAASEENAVGKVCVYVCGAVCAPGVYELPEDARIADAVAAAGGMTDEADGSAVNLSAYVLDEMQITIPLKSEESANPVVIGASGAAPETSAGVSGSGDTAGGSGSAGETADQAAAKVNINTATAAELVTLNGIGESRAADIIAYRDEHGAFGSIEDIMKVSGIKNAVFEKIKDHITV